MIYPKLNFAKNNNCVPHRPRDQAQKDKNNLREYWTQLTLRMRETTRVRFPIGFLIFSIFSTRIRIQIEFARPHVSDIYPDYFCYPGLLWEYWKLSIRRGGHLEYKIHDTTDLGIFEFSGHTIPGS